MTRAVPVTLLLVALAFPVVFTLPFPRHVMIMIFLYGALATAWNIIAGYCGQIALGQAVFFGDGAYTSSLLFRETGLTPWVGMIAGVVVAVIVARVVGYPVFRLRDHYFAIATIAVGLLFAFADAVQVRLRGIPLPLVGVVPVQLIQTIPYVLTVLLLAGFVGRTVAPRAIGIPYVKER